MIAAAVVAEIEAAAILTLKEKAAENRGAQPALKPKGKTGKAKRKASPALVFLTKEDKAPAKDVSKAPVALLPENSLGKKAKTTEQGNPTSTDENNDALSIDITASESTGITNLEELGELAASDATVSNTTDMEVEVDNKATAKEPPCPLGTEEANPVIEAAVIATAVDISTTAIATGE